MKLQEGNVFAPVSHSVHRRAGGGMHGGGRGMCGRGHAWQALQWPSLLHACPYFA